MHQWWNEKQTKKLWVFVYIVWQNLSSINLLFLKSGWWYYYMRWVGCSSQFYEPRNIFWDSLAREIDNTTHRHSGFPEAKSHGQSFSHEDIGIMTTHESSLQLIQLPWIEIGSRSTTFLTSASICIIRLWKEKNRVEHQKKKNHLIHSW